MQQLLDSASFYSNKIANDVFGISQLYPAQRHVLQRLALMQFKTSSVSPMPFLFVHPTGGGKSLVRDVHSVMFRGASLTIVPTLALGSDQKQKVYSKANQTFGTHIG